MFVSCFSLDGVDVEVLGAARSRRRPCPRRPRSPGPTNSEPRSCRPKQREGGGPAAPVGDERAGRARAQLADPRLLAVEDVVQEPGAARLGEELGAEADQAARGDEVLHAHPAGAVVDHLLHAALAQREAAA